MLRLQDKNTANQLSYIDLTCLKQWIKGEAFSKHAQIFTILQDPQWFTKLRINSSYIPINKFSFEGNEIKQIIHDMVIRFPFLTRRLNPHP